MNVYNMYVPMCVCVCACRSRIQRTLYKVRTNMYIIYGPEHVASSAPFASLFAAYVRCTNATQNRFTKRYNQHRDRIL